MPFRVLFLALCAAALTSCADYYQQSNDPPQMRQEMHQNAMGQTRYTYKPADQPAQ